MAINYTNLFADLGKLTKYYNQFNSDASSLSGYVDAIETQFAADQQEAAINGLRPTQEQSWLTNYVNRRATLAGYGLARLQDLPTVLSQIGATASDQNTIFLKLIEQMTADSETINRSVASIGSVTAAAANVGNGTVIGTLILDSVSSLGSRQGVQLPSHHLYRGLASELVIAETHSVICTADSFYDNTTEGGESFSWNGGYADVQNGVGTEGSGSIGTITAIHGRTSQYIANADFESFSVANTPDSWTITAGTVGVNIFSTTTSGKFYHGASALKLTGDGATAAITLIQPFTSTQIKAGQAYCVTVRLLADATIAAGTLTISFTGTGYTAGSTEKINIAPGSLPTSYTLEKFFVNMPLEIPADFALTVTWSGTPTSAKNIYLDDFGMCPVTFGAGMGLIAVRGSTPFARNDKFTFATSTTEGVVQKWMRQVFGYMLPSTASSPSIADSVAT